MRLGLGIRLGPNTGGASAPAPYAGFSTYLDFKNQVYAENGTGKALSAFTGYTFTDNVDNVPNIDASGFTATTAQLSRLSVNANPYTTDQDFIVWTVATFIAAAASVEILANLGGTAGNRISLFRNAADGFLHVNSVGGTGGDRIAGGGAVVGTSRHVLLHRRRGGKDTTATKIASTVTVGVESAATTWSAPSSALQIGNYVDGSLQANAAIEGLFMKTGSFDDAAITAILAAA